MFFTKSNSFRKSVYSFLMLPHLKQTGVSDEFRSVDVSFVILEHRVQPQTGDAGLPLVGEFHLSHLPALKFCPGLSQ